MNENKLKMAVIGTGMAWERLHFPAIKELKDKYEIVALCNKTKEKALEAAKKIKLDEANVYSDYKEMLKRDDIDVVDVLVPISENYEVAKDVLNAGKNLIAEKPFSATLEGANELVKLKNDKKLDVMVAENFRYDECNLIIKKAILEKEIGDVVYFIYNKAADFEKSMVGDTFGAKEWRQHPNFKGGIFLDGGVHDIALMRFLFGNVNEIKTMGMPLNEDYCPFLSINSLIKFDNDVIGNYSYFSKGGEHQKPMIGLRIFGTLGDIFLESKDCGHLFINKADGSSKKVKFAVDEGYYNELLNYFDAAKNGKKIVSTAEKEIEDMKVIFDIIDSL